MKMLCIHHPLPEFSEGFRIALLHFPVILRGRTAEEVLEHRAEPDKGSPVVPAQRFFKGPGLLVQARGRGPGGRGATRGWPYRR